MIEHRNYENNVDENDTDRSDCSEIKKSNTNESCRMDISVDTSVYV